MNKKGAKNSKETSSYEIRDIVLAKVRGFPPWPGMIVDPTSVPENVSRERPSNKKTNWYCVRFFPAGDYAWLVAKDISKLKKHEIEAYIGEPYKKSGDLLSGYTIALDPTKWEEQLQVAALEAEEETADAEVDELASEVEDDEKKLTKSKKRKREIEVSPMSKSKLKGKAKRDTSDLALKKATNASKGRKNGPKSKAVVESEDDGELTGGRGVSGDAGPSTRTAESAKKSKKDKEGDDVDAAVAKDPEAKKVREWRHQLQKQFLSVKAQPKAEDMPAVDALFTSIEQYDKMNISYLQFSKIGKVMRHITALPPDKLPRNDEFNFKQRSNALVERWHQILSANKLNGNAADGALSSANKDDDGHQLNGASLDMVTTIDHPPDAGASLEQPGAIGELTNGQAE